MNINNQLGLDLRMRIVYLTTNLVSDKMYVGAHTTFEPLSKKYLGSNKELKKDIKSFGIENFTKKILRFCNSDAELYYWEKHFLKHFNLVEKESGYNINNVGYTDGNKVKTGDSLRGRKKSKEHKRKLKESRNSEVTSQKIKDSLSGRKRLKLSRMKISEAAKERKRKVCKHCNNEFDPVNYAKWHGERCLKNPDVDSEKEKKLRSETNSFKGKKHRVVDCEYCNKKNIPYPNHKQWHINGKCIKNGDQ
jgi:group I intron endonuclease